MAPRNRTHKPDLPLTQYCPLSICASSLPKFGARGNLHLERRALAYRRLDQDPTTMHLNDLLGDGEPKTSAADGLGQRAVDLVELLEDASSLVIGNAWPCIGHADVEVVVDCLRGHAHLTPGSELDRIADKVKQHLREALFVAKANGQGLSDLGLEDELLALCQRFGGRPNCLNHALNGVLGHVQGELA